jgi:hypothetical protein
MKISCASETEEIKKAQEDKRELLKLPSKVCPMGEGMGGARWHGWWWMPGGTPGGAWYGGWRLPGAWTCQA